MAQPKLSNGSNWKSILNEWDLSNFENEFSDHGFTDPTDWVHIDENDMTQMGFKKGHMLRFNRKLKQLVMSQNESPGNVEGKNDDHYDIVPSYNSTLGSINFNYNRSELLGGDRWIELGEFRMGQVDEAHFSISHRINRKTCMIFRSDGNIYPGPRNDYGLFDRQYIKGLKNVKIGDGWIEFGDWRMGICDGDRDHISISHRSKKTCMIWRSDGTRHKGPRQDYNNYWNRNNNGNNVIYGTYCVLDKDDDNKYIKWIQFGDNWRIGDIDTDHFSVSANKAFFKYDEYCTAVIYRRDGTIHPGRRQDYGLWRDKRKNQTRSMLQ